MLQFSAAGAISGPGSFGKLGRGRYSFSLALVLAPYADARPGLPSHLAGVERSHHPHQHKEPGTEE